ncbi:hypothetical protein [Wolbachia endosymbiont (group E) of Neria commutata]|uniref:hypothetical protein n=1 Tax=Wolbachia endosymbiont (group E) of Neria commutata TaxID=3066149 RepID=UPI003132FF55
MSGKSKYFTNNFQGNNVDYDTIKAGLHAYIGGFAGKSETEIAQKIKEYCQKNEIKLKTNKQNSLNKSTHTTRSTSSSASGNVTINKGLSVWDYLLLYNLFGNKTTIINNPPAAAYSAPPQEKKDKSKEGNANGAIFLVALFVITHLAVCAIYHEYFKKEAEKSGKSIDYLANCQLGLAIFQLAFGLASLVAAGVFLDQSEIFFPLLINTFICLGSAYLFYRERNNTLKTEVKPYMELAKLLIDDEHRESKRTRPSTGHPSATPDGSSPTCPQGHPDASHYEPPPPYSPPSGYGTFNAQQPYHSTDQHPSAPPAYDNQSCVGPNPFSQVSYADVVINSQKKL